MTEADQRRLLFLAQQRVEDAKDDEDGEVGEDSKVGRRRLLLSLVVLVITGLRDVGRRIGSWLSRGCGMLLVGEDTVADKLIVFDAGMT